MAEKSELMRGAAPIGTIGQKALNHSNVNICLCVEDRKIRDPIAMILRNCGFNDVFVGKTQSDLEHGFLINDPDLLIIGTDFPEGDAFKIIDRIRLQEFGKNMFLPIIVVTDIPSPELIKSIVDSGTDDILIAPFSTQQFKDRIDALVFHRKSYVVTYDYIGPNRRKSSKPRDGTENIPSVDPPNVLRAKMVGDLDLAEVQREIPIKAREVELQRLQRYCIQINWLIDRIVPALEQHKHDDKSKAHLVSLLHVAESARFRTKDTTFEHISHLCGNLITVANSLISSGSTPNNKEIKLLRPMGLSIRASFAELSAAEFSNRLMKSMEAP